MEMQKRMLAVGGGMGAGIIAQGQKYGFAGAIVDVDEKLLARQCEHFDVPGYTSLEAALEAHDDFGAAYIATPNRFHAEQALALAPLGIPVFMEKPLGISPEECQQVVDAYRASQGWLQIDFEYRFSPLYRQAGEILHAGEVGELRSIYMEYTPGPCLPGKGWRLDTAIAGGTFGERLCHMVDLFRYWARAEIAHLRVTPGPRTMPWYDNTQTDNLVADFHMANGVYAHLQYTPAATALPIRGQQEREDWTEFGHRLAVYLLATNGCIQIDIWKRQLRVVRRDANDGYEPRILRTIDYSHLPFMASHHDMAGMLADFVRRVATGEGPRLPLEDSYQTMLAVFEADKQLVAGSLEANTRFD